RRQHPDWQHDGDYPHRLEQQRHCGGQYARHQHPIGSTIATTQRHPRRLVLDVIFLGLACPDLNCNLTGTYCSRHLAIRAEYQDDAPFNVADTGGHGLLLNTSRPPAEEQH
ncbi:hypothetical protein JG688_00007567, partial [Phytophthora aleatoria]